MIAPLLVAAALGGAPDFAFAFSNGSGDRLVALDPVEGPERLTRATCDGRVVAVAFAGRQARDARDSGRQVAANFERVEGALFEVRGATVGSNASCLLATAGFFAARPPLALAAARKACDAAAAAAAAGEGSRAVERCVEVGVVRGGKLLLVLYARSGESALARLMLLAGGRPAMRTFEAIVEEGAPGCWRADDGCVFDPSAYRVPFALAGTAVPMLFALWDGPEGQHIELLEPRGGTLEVRATAYRYWAPP